jgi:hypothetical protein
MYTLIYHIENILPGFARKTNLAPRRTKPSSSNRLITQTLTRPLVWLTGILSKCRIGEHYWSVANSEQSDQR